MSKEVLSWLEISRSLWDNVADIKEHKTTVADEADLSRLEQKLDNKINALSKRIDRLQNLIEEIVKSNNNLKEDIKEELASHLKEEQSVLNESYKELSQLIGYKKRIANKLKSLF